MRPDVILLLAGAALTASACGGEAPPARAEAPATGLVLVTVDTTTIDAPLALPSQLYVEHDAVVAAPGVGMKPLDSGHELNNL